MQSENMKKMQPEIYRINKKYENKTDQDSMTKKSMETMALYKNHMKEKLTEEQFQNPTSEYRGAPFWAWNNKLDRDQLLRQIEYFKEMGMGGFHIHCRAGLDTPYM